MKALNYRHVSKYISDCSTFCFIIGCSSSSMSINILHIFRAKSGIMQSALNSTSAPCFEGITISLASEDIAYPMTSAKISAPRFLLYQSFQKQISLHPHLGPFHCDLLKMVYRHLYSLPANPPKPLRHQNKAYFRSRQ